MADTRPICVDCNERFTCIRNMAANEYANGEGVQLGDLYQCSGCRTKILVGLATEALYKEQAPETVARCRKDAVSSC